MTDSLVMASHVGPLEVVGEGGAVVAVRFDADPGRVDLDGEVEPVVREAVRQLRAYFEGRLRHVDLPLRPGGTPFQRRVWDEVSRVPWGRTTSYGALAAALGMPPGAARAVGAANAANPVPIVVPCHRVVGADGSLTGYAGGLARKRALLAVERAVPSHEPTLF